MIIFLSIRRMKITTTMMMRIIMIIEDRKENEIGI